MNIEKESKLLQDFGEPDVELSGFELWIHGREFEDDMDYWDGNWLQVTVHLTTDNASVWEHGSFIHSPELLGWMKELEIVYAGSYGRAALNCMEPIISILVDITKTGSGTMHVNLLKEDSSQEHRFEFKIDQSYLPKAIKSLYNVFEHFPVRGNPD